jgi:hypothetical protein
MGSSNSKKLSPEEMKYLTPTGLYPSCSWDLKTIRKLIMEKKLAPFYPGREEKDAPDLDECPICFMFYGGGLNRTNCCHKDVCTGEAPMVKSSNVLLLKNSSSQFFRMLSPNQKTGHSPFELDLPLLQPRSLHCRLFGTEDT